MSGFGRGVGAAALAVMVCVLGAAQGPAAAQSVATDAPVSRPPVFVVFTTGPRTPLPPGAVATFEPGTSLPISPPPRIIEFTFGPRTPLPAGAVATFEPTTPQPVATAAPRPTARPPPPSAGDDDDDDELLRAWTIALLVFVAFLGGLCVALVFCVLRQREQKRRREAARRQSLFAAQTREPLLGAEHVRDPENDAAVDDATAGGGGFITDTHDAAPTAAAVAPPAPGVPQGAAMAAGGGEGRGGWEQADAAQPPPPPPDDEPPRFVEQMTSYAEGMGMPGGGAAVFTSPEGGEGVGYPIAAPAPLPPTGGLGPGWQPQTPRPQPAVPVGFDEAQQQSSHLPPYPPALARDAGGDGFGGSGYPSPYQEATAADGYPPVHGHPHHPDYAGVDPTSVGQPAGDGVLTSPPGSPVATEQPSPVSVFSPLMLTEAPGLPPGERQQLRTLSPLGYAAATASTVSSRTTRSPSPIHSPPLLPAVAAARGWTPPPAPQPQPLRQRQRPSSPGRTGSLPPYTLVGSPAVPASAPYPPTAPRPPRASPLLPPPGPVVEVVDGVGDTVGYLDDAYRHASPTQRRTGAPPPRRVSGGTGPPPAQVHRVPSTFRSQVANSRVPSFARVPSRHTSTYATRHASPAASARSASGASSSVGSTVLPSEVAPPPAPPVPPSRVASSRRASALSARPTSSQHASAAPAAPDFLTIEATGEVVTAEVHRPRSSYAASPKKPRPAPPPSDPFDDFDDASRFDMRYSGPPR